MSAQYPPPFPTNPNDGLYSPGNAGGALRGATFSQAIQRFFQKYADFNGRASRSEFWWWTLANLIVGAVFFGLSQAAGFFRIIEYIWDAAILVPTLALGARRLHDTGRSGWWQLLSIILCIGTIVLIVFWAMEPDRKGDKYNV